MSDKQSDTNGIFSLKSNKKVKPLKRGAAIESRSEMLDDGSYAIIDNFHSGEISFEQALNSQSFLNDNKKYLDNLKKFFDIKSRLSFHNIEIEGMQNDGK